MGIIGAVTPGTKSSRPIPRDIEMTAEHVKPVGRIPVKFYSRPPQEPTLTFNMLPDLEEISHNCLDTLWKISWPLRSPRPGWSGTMQAICDGPYPGKSLVTFLPMIDMDPTDMSCVYTTLNFVASLAQNYHVSPVVTFDQPLWWKAKMIVAAEPPDSPLHSIVLRLGGFHTEMSFLGAIGRIMAGSGIQELLEGVFAPNAVPHMLSGKAVARSVRGHFLIDSVLHALLVALAFNQPLDFSDRDEDDAAFANSVESEELQRALHLYDMAMEKSSTYEDLEHHQEVENVQERLLHAKQDLAPKRTARLWILYMDMVDLLRQFLRAERTGNWQHHLKVLQDMLPFLAAAGHNSYTKSLHIYLQDMLQLEKTHPEVHRDFLSGHHVLRRSDRYWAGLSTDLVIEQMLMRSVKSAGGLTRGRGMDESQRTQWLLSMPACAEMNNAMQEVTKMEFITSEQHAETTTARQDKDDRDMKHILGFLLVRNPFTCPDSSLRNISTGMVADSSVNADSAREVGLSILQSMNGKNVSDFSFRKKNQVVTMDTKRCAKVDGDPIQVDPQLLFQRLTMAANHQTDDFELSSLFEFELSTPPASLFDPSGLMREAQKAKLFEAYPLHEEDFLIENEQFVLDGGSLLYKLPWKRGETFEEICQAYAQYVTNRYGKPFVVFDGYMSGPSTKDSTHLRRSSGMLGPEMKDFQKLSVFNTKKDLFLSHPANKQAFVTLLGETLEGQGCRIQHADGDADTLIVKTALKVADSNTTIVIGEDTDLVVLLCHHTKSCHMPIFFRSDRQSCNKRRLWNIQKLQQQLNPDVCNALPFIHAISGCDTTSRLFGIGKSVPLRRMKIPAFQQASQAFNIANQSPETVIAAGEKALLCLYNGQLTQTLDILRHHRFTEKVATCATAVPVQSLPPTSAAAKYHSLRVYLQTQEWRTLSQDLDPQLWGWHLTCGRYEPRTTDLPPAPEALLRVVRCNCKSECKSRACTCRKHGLECSLACGNCRGLTCANSPSFDEVDLPDSALDTTDLPDLPDLGDLSSIL